MQIVFISNIMTPHQKPFCSGINDKGHQVYFIETQTRTEDIPVGWREDEIPDCVKSWEWCQKNPDLVRSMIMEADVVLIGSAPDRMIAERLKAGRLTFKYSERFYKTGTPRRRWLRDAVAAWLHHGRFQRYPLYMLCASAYTARDAARFGNYKDRCYKWGYFPQTRTYQDVAGLIAEKKPHSMLWVGRMLDWKHPDDAVRVAESLRDEGYEFRLNIIGSGELEEALHAMIKEKKLEDCVCMLGSMKPEQVREHMEQSEIFLFTSDWQEGWGAVLNESMNSGCAVVASHAIGSVPFLLKDGENGLVYRADDIDTLYQKAKYLLDHPAQRQEMGTNAYRTIIETWNAQMAAEQLLKLAQAILDGEKSPELFVDGPCSKAEALSDGRSA